MVNDLRHPDKEVRIALVGKYTALHDAYISVVEALKHGGIPEHATIDIKWVDSEELNVDNVDEVLGDVNGILVPGGFGLRGVEGMILAARYARENKIPYLGLCLACRYPSLNLHVTYADSTMHTVSNLTRTQHIRSLH